VTALPQHPTRLFTIAEYAALGEDEHGRTELQEGRLLMSPSPTPDHMIAMARMVVQLAAQVPAGVEVVPDVDIDLELVEPSQPGWSRRPDLVIVDRTAVERVRREGGLLRASEVLIVVEIVSPGSIRTDHMIKRGEYADAGIPYYWIVDIDPPISLVSCRLTAGFGYQDSGAVTGEFTTSEPFPIKMRLDQLL
jgi:Uma2 family endonuclease